MRTWETQRAEWERLPVDDLGEYQTGPELDLMSDFELRVWTGKFERVRYTGWRNCGNLWRQHMGLDECHGRVLDYGSGCGIEALQYARSGNQVSLADINSGSLAFAQRVLHVHGYQAQSAVVVEEPGLLPSVPDGWFDMVVMNGVLHHIPDPLPSVTEVHRVLRPGGQFRVMVYTDMYWRLVTGSEPPEDVEGHPQRELFVRATDPVGDWADWYDGDRLQSRFGALLPLQDWQYIGFSADGLPQGQGRFGIGIMEKPR